MNRLLIIVLVGLLGVTRPVGAHDGPHPDVSETPKWGGVVAPVILLKDLKSPKKSRFKYKAEVVTSADGSVWVYLFDLKMNDIALNDWPAKISASLEVGKGASFKVYPFELTKAKLRYAGVFPRPYSEVIGARLEIKLSIGAQDLTAAFQNLK